MRSQSSSKYFGETQNNRGDWIDYISSPEKEFITSNFFVTDVKNATWSGQIKLRYKVDDSYYLGPGLYDLKLRRYTGGSTNSAGESNTLQVTLSEKVLTPSPSPSPIPTPTPTPTSIPTPKPTPKSSPSPSPIVINDPETGSIAGVVDEIDLSGYGISDNQDEPTPTPSPELALNQGRVKSALLGFVGLVLIGIASFLGYQKFQKPKTQVEL